MLSFKSSSYSKEAKYFMLMAHYHKYFLMHVTHMRNVCNECVITPLEKTKVFHL